MSRKPIARHRVRPQKSLEQPRKSSAKDPKPLESGGAADEVGYGKPPKSTRFKPGQSGNPKGRPKGSKNISTLIQEELDKKIVVKEGGSVWKVRKRDAIVKRLVNKALEGQDRSIQTILNLDDVFEAALQELRDNQGKPSSEGSMAGGDLEILNAFEEMVRESVKAENSKRKKGKRDVDDE